MATATKWQYETIIEGKRYYARKTRSDITVRIEREGDTSEFAEFALPKFMTLEGACRQASYEVKDSDIRP